MSAPPSHAMSLTPSNSVLRWLVFLLILAGIYFFHGFLVPVLAALVISLVS